MLVNRKKSRLLGLGAGLSIAALTLAGCAAAGESGGSSESTDSSGSEETTLTMFIDDATGTVASVEAMVEAYKAIAPNVTIEVETRPGGADGDNLVKTRLATGEMNDIFLYNTGSLFQALNPTEQLAPLTGEPFVDLIVDSFIPTVTAGGDVYGVPTGTAMGGGILYNMDIYEELSLEVPLTWDEFMANNAVIKEAGIDPVIQTYGETWTSQLFVLGDYHNVATEEPNFAEEYTGNQAKYATSAAAIRGFEYLQELYELGYYNADYATATFNDGILKLGNGEGAHYPMLTFAIASLEELAPETTDSVGFFAQPGPSADTNGLTVWTSAGFYIPKTSEYIDEAKAFLAFVMTPEACEAQTAAVGQSGPYFVEGCGVADDLFPVVQDMLPYFEREGGTTPALEFVSPVKGPALEQITVATGSGQYTAQEAAELYDQDVEKQAQQLGLPGW